jgi:hypothetical protein
MRCVFLALLLGGLIRADEGLTPQKLPQAAKDAEWLFRRMEATLQAARPLCLRFQIKTKGAPKEGLMDGSLVLAHGNKARLEMKGQPVTAFVVSDGTRMKGSMSPGTGAACDKPTPDSLGKTLVALLSRAGPIAVCVEATSPWWRGGPFETDLEFRVAGLSCGRSETVAGRAACVVCYQIVYIHRPGRAETVKLWIDARTYLPLKREVTANISSKMFWICETYEVQFADRLDPKVFTLPE